MGYKRFFIEVKVEHGDEFTWERMRTSIGAVYYFLTYEQAEKTANMCYPDSLGTKVRISSEMTSVGTE